MTKTRDVRLFAGQNRRKAKNFSTVVAQTATSARAAEYRCRFVANYQHFAERCQNFEVPGLAIVAIHEETGQIGGLACIAAKAESPTFAVIGRHGWADLYLEACPTLALRHMAVVIEPPKRWEKGNVELRFRVLDLQTHEGFVDETGQSLRSLCSEGPAMLRAGGHTFYFLPLGDRTDWPERAEDAWSFLPERVYFDEVTRFAQASQRIPVRRQVGRITHVTRVGPAIPFHQGLLSDDEAPIAHLSLSSDRGMTRLSVGEDALARGILIGRYDRCSPGSGKLDGSVSRVHLLILRVGTEVFAFDTCTTNGTWKRCFGQGRVFLVEGSGEFRLGLEDAQAQWEWIS